MIDKINKTVNIGKRFLVKRSPEILTTVGLFGMLVSLYETGKAMPKAMQIIEQEKKASGADDISNTDKVKHTWKVFAKPAVIFVASSVFILTANRVLKKRSACITSAYLLTEAAYQDYKRKAEEVVGAGTAKVISKELNKERADNLANDVKNDNVASTTVTNTYVNTAELYWAEETFAGIRFKTTPSQIKTASMQLENKLLRDGFVSLNDVYFWLKLPPTDIGNLYGWNYREDGDGVGIRYSSMIVDDIPYIIIDYSNVPHLDYDSYL